MTPSGDAPDAEKGQVQLPKSALKKPKPGPLPPVKDFNDHGEKPPMTPKEIKDAKKREQDEAYFQQRRRHMSKPSKLAPQKPKNREERDHWGHKMEYFFACLGYAVGMGNIWRFPYFCYRNGGGAFLIPYLLALVVFGIPVLFLEMALGQYASLGMITVWKKICPLFTGVGYTVILVLVMISMYYNVLIAYALFYLFASITDNIPWSRCDNKWNTEFCITTKPGEAQYNGSVTSVLVNATKAVGYNASEMLTTMSPNATGKPKLKTPTEEFFERHLLQVTGGISEVGVVQWPLVVCLIVSWVVIFFCLWKGVKSMGKAVYFTAGFPYVVLTILLVRGVTLPGSMDGIIYYLKPEWSKLSQPQVWGEACVQIFLSLALGTGGWVTLSSYNKYSNNCRRDAIIVAIANSVTSLYAGFVIFSVLGFMAYKKGVNVADVADVGPGLAFVAYPEGLAMMPGAPFWSICFFVTMFTVGLDSLFTQVETIICALVDEFPKLKEKRKIVTLVFCVILMLLGIPLVTQGGIYIVTLMDWYVPLFSLAFISLTEILVLNFFYGYKKFGEDIKTMIGFGPNYYDLFCWLIATPILLLLIVIFIAVNYKAPYYGDYSFPGWANDIGWCLAFIPCTIVPIVMAVIFLRAVRNWETFVAVFRGEQGPLLRSLITPMPDWGPAVPEDRNKRYEKQENKNRDAEQGAPLVVESPI
ncbi:unnamed protein product [Owenia fusiformis]|uniref:Transporter n=1 Tax=Owenia fusiformis TaxID=6347 RepID=A0A8J1Y153_OWEFU|nr:unnamed protein product [Owenia fusiformis]